MNLGSLTNKFPKSNRGPRNSLLELYCVMCGKEFYCVADYAMPKRYGSNKRAIRPRRSHTCSKKCSRRLMWYRKGVIKNAK